MNEVDRHDLEALKDLMTAKFEGVERTLKGMDEALKVAAVERTKKDAELNEVRQRFVDRRVFEDYRNTQDKALDTALLAVNQRFQPLESFKGKALGFGTLLVLLSGTAGAVIDRAFGG